MDRVTFAGNLIVDYVKKIDSYPEKGRLSSILDISRCVGGCACNTAVSLSRFDKGISVTSLGRVGDDENGRYIRETLESEGIRCEFTVDPKLPTSFTDVMSEPIGDRTFFHARGANSAFCFDDIPFDRLDCNLLHIGYILLLDAMDSGDAEYGTHMAKTLAKIRSLGVKISVDVVSENSDRFSRIVTPSLKYCDYFIVNEIEASKVSGIDIRDADGRMTDAKVGETMQRLLDMGVHELVVVHSPEGGWALAKSGEFAFAPSVNLPQGTIKGHVGAGDAFCAGMLYGICKDFALKESLKFAAGAAACNLTEANSIDGMRDYHATMRAIEQWEK